ncbi:MAG: DUF2019 domain-containing protein [Pirellulaceae bacterium]|nr:DUF2019 domain-containing protein [Pirellulaceae bacterium]
MFAQNNLVELQSRYRISAEGTADPTPKVANEYHAVLHECYNVLAKSDEGRRLITALMSDSNPHVRCWAAAHSLQWAAAEARNTLEQLRDAGGVCSFDAEMVLAEYQKRSLTF